MNESEKRVKRILNVDVDAADQIEANQVCIKEPKTKVKSVQNDAKKNILNTVREQVGIL